MRIGSSIPKDGEQAKLNKWYFGVQILKCPPTQWKVFRPYFFFYCVKWTDFGEAYKFNGRPEKRIGGWKSWSFPFGISIEIIKY